MKRNLLIPTITAAAIASLLLGLSAQARPQNYFSGSVSSQQAGWNNGCDGYKRHHNNGRYNNVGYNNGANGYGFNNGRYNNNYFNNGFLNNSFNNGANGLFARGQQLQNEQLRIQQRLANSSLRPDQVSRLQGRLAAIQTEQATLNGQFSSRITGEQSRLQSLLSSGNLNPYQTTQVQNRLANLLAAQNNLSGGGLFSGSGFLSSLRNSLGF